MSTVPTTPDDAFAAALDTGPPIDWATARRGFPKPDEAMVAAALHDALALRREVERLGAIYRDLQAQYVTPVFEVVEEDIHEDHIAVAHSHRIGADLLHDVLAGAARSLDAACDEETHHDGGSEDETLEAVTAFLQAQA